MTIPTVKPDLVSLNEKGAAKASMPVTLPPITQLVQEHALVNTIPASEAAESKPWRPWESEPEAVASEARPAPKAPKAPEAPAVPPAPSLSQRPTLQTVGKDAGDGLSGHRSSFTVPRQFGTVGLAKRVTEGGTARPVANLVAKQPQTVLGAAVTSVQLHPTTTVPGVPQSVQFVAAESEEDRRVTIWNVREQRKLSGNAAPFKRNLSEYLALHPVPAPISPICDRHQPQHFVGDEPPPC